MLRLIRSVLAPLIIEGQDFLIADDDVAFGPFLTGLMSEALCSIHTTNARSLIRKRELFASGLHGKAVSDRINDTEADKSLGSCFTPHSKSFLVDVVPVFLCPPGVVHRLCWRCVRCEGPVVAMSARIRCFDEFIHGDKD